MTALRQDGFLGGRLHLWQPTAGYRAGIDAVLLAAATPAEPGQSVLELGCGAGVASLCLAARVPGLAMTGVELQPAYAALARRNASGTGLPLEVVEADLAALPPGVKAQSFDHAILNPPYFRRDRGSAAPDPGRETAMGEATPLAEWIAAAARRLRPGGRLTAIQRAERLPDMLAALCPLLGCVELLPLAPRDGRAAKLVLLRARKGRQGPFRLHAPLTLHEGAAHLDDGDSYTPDVAAILRDGAALSWPG
ncbi:methyltransferase [Rhodovulum sp. BSW8]|uniref:tRNA1(Val) A37 N6-methylase TrmN6 n=1 Tax=Rhodovulum visakhapatnamense TaxID=364297 RepID=A0A4R8FUT8_9RHOB|nr:MULTISPECIES: methyltransferase [Rhodovulum]RBO53577.1 methyltransferase [Rhodovulum sp. BSW8]TDX27755.1 tRNA1(Val) A37 N6-methylase TrmN6 [Rhodovulum visakhapatnamense]